MMTFQVHIFPVATKTRISSLNQNAYGGGLSELSEWGGETRRGIIEEWGKGTENVVQ
jgi:hypothetical protein